MKKKLVLALCLAATLTSCETPLRSVSAREYQCGRHFVETSGFFQIIAGITYNRTRDDNKEGSPKAEEWVVNTPANPTLSILRRRNGILYYRGKACVEYKEAAE
jgi:hypothetical protein